MKGLEIFARLFSGRKDIYGLNQMCMKEPLTSKVYKDHLEGVQRIGVYPIYDKKFINWAAVDIDEDDFEKAKLIYEKAEHYNLKVFLERSKSKGWHIWAFFEKPIEAVKVRLVFEMILEELNIKCEFFPKQDEVNESSPYGNFIFLPLFGGSVSNGRTIFIDKDNKVIIDKAEDLHKIQLNSATLIPAIITQKKLERRQVVLKETNGGVEPAKAYTRILPCIENIKKGVPQGHRDECCFRIAINYKEKGIAREDIETLLNDWNLKNKPPLEQKDLIKIVNSVYKGGYKSYGCDSGIISVYCNKDACPLMQAQDRKDLIEKGVMTLVFRDASAMVFRKKNYEYRMTNFEFTKSGKFKVSLTLSKDGKIAYKNPISFDVAAQRAQFVKATGDDEINTDLIKLEDLVRKQIEKEEQDKITQTKQLYVMTEEEKKEAIEFLDNTIDILYKVIDTTNRLGVMGEEIMRLMVYLCFTSRIIDNPLSITVKGESSSGKSFSCQNVQKLIPEEGYHFITRATQNAFFHLAEDGMQHRIIYINEIQGSEDSDYSIRTAQSEGDLILMMPIKDPATGNMETITKKVKGPVGFLVTTTKANMFDENETRNFSVFSDDSPQLTKKIGNITIRRAKGEDFKVDEKELNLWKNIQRLLNPDLKVIIPYAEEVFSSFPDKPVRIRRDRERFRVLIEIITILHQHQRKQEKKDNNVLLVSTLADYLLAKMISESTLVYTIYETGPSAEELWQKIKEMGDNYKTPPDTKDHEFTFKYRDIADYIAWNINKVKKWMGTLIKFGLVEYLEGSIGGKGKASVFKISGKHLEFASETLVFLPTIENLYEKYPCDPKLFYNPFTGQPISPVNAEAPKGLLDGVSDEK